MLPNGLRSDDLVVLNALRHQRGAHLAEVFGYIHQVKCSTPCGIKEGRTTGPA